MVEALKKNERIFLPLDTTIADGLAVNKVGVNTFYNLKSGILDKMVGTVRLRFRQGCAKKTSARCMIKTSSLAHAGQWFFVPIKQKFKLRWRCFATGRSANHHTALPHLITPIVCLAHPWLNRSLNVISIFTKSVIKCDSNNITECFGCRL